MNGAKPDSTRVTYLPVLCLGILLILTGCISPSFGGPADQDNLVTVVGNNSANVTQTFTVWVVNGEVKLDGILIRKMNGEVDNASPGEGVVNYKLDGDYGYVTSVEPPPNRSRLQSQYTLAPSEMNRSTIENFTTGSTIVVSVSEGGRVVSLVTANCDEQALVGLEVTSYPNPPGGVSASYGCRHR